MVTSAKISGPARGSVAFSRARLSQLPRTTSSSKAAPRSRYDEKYVAVCGSASQAPTRQRSPPASPCFASSARSDTDATSVSTASSPVSAPWYRSAITRPRDGSPSVRRARQSVPSQPRRRTTAPGARKMPVCSRPRASTRWTTTARPASFQICSSSSRPTQRSRADVPLDATGQ